MSYKSVVTGYELAGEEGPEDGIEEGIDQGAISSSSMIPLIR